MPFCFVLAVTAPHGLGSAYAQGAIATPAAVAALAGQHPAEYYKRAGELFKEGKKDDAVFVLYLGQLHFRTYLHTHREADQNQSMGTFAALSEQIGKPIAQYAFGNIPRSRKLSRPCWHTMPRTLTISSPPEKFADAHEEVRKGLAAMKTKTLSEETAFMPSAKRTAWRIASDAFRTARCVEIMCWP